MRQPRAIDYGWTYNRAFAAPDGHTLAAAYEDMSAMPAEKGVAA